MPIADCEGTRFADDFGSKLVTRFWPAYQEKLNSVVDNETAGETYCKRADYWRLNRTVIPSPEIISLFAQGQHR